MSNRFDYVAYDAQATSDQAWFKEQFMKLEAEAEARLKSSRAKALFITNIEVSYMWIGKAIRDDQIVRNGSAPLQEGRNNE